MTWRANNFLTKQALSAGDSTISLVKECASQSVYVVNHPLWKKKEQHIVEGETSEDRVDQNKHTSTG